MTDTPYDVLVIGSGAAGLTAALALAQTKRVLVLAKADLEAVLPLHPEVETKLAQFAAGRLKRHESRERTPSARARPLPIAACHGSKSHAVWLLLLCGLRGMIRLRGSCVVDTADAGSATRCEAAF